MATPYSKENQHPKYPYEDYQYEVSNSTTNLGYNDWVEHSITRDNGDPYATNQ
jgi:hypothetical protein